MFELPQHLAGLNTLAPEPSNNGLSPADDVWSYLNTDELFGNFGIDPTEYESKLTASAEKNQSQTQNQQQQQQSTLSSALPSLTNTPAPAKTENTPLPLSQSQGPSSDSLPADLKSFIEQFASDPSTFSSENYDALTRSLTGNTVNISDILGSSSSTSSGNDASGSGESEDGRPSGAKKLRSLGAGQAEIEEDKRRRNTEASARFRAKKKEREQALEKRANELEAQVAQLSADKSSLENENRLLKAIVLGGRAGGQAASDALDQLIGKRKRSDE